MEQTPEWKRPYSSPTLTRMTLEQATEFVAQRASLTGAAANCLQSLRLQSDAKRKSRSAHNH